MGRKNELKKTSKTGIYESINSKGQKEYFGQVKVNYKQRRINLTKTYEKCKTLKEAVKYLEIWRDSLENGTSVNYKSKNTTLDNYFYENYIETKKDKVDYYTDIKSFYSNYISKEIGRENIKDIENIDVQKIVDKLERLGKLSNRSVRKVQQYLRPVFNKMIKERLTTHNPATFIDFKEKLNNDRNLEFILRSDFLQTLKYILDEVEYIKNYKVKLMFYISIYCVRRLNEVLTIEWDEVNLKEKYIIVPENKTKNNRPSKFFINDKIVLLLKQIKNDNPNDEYVFQSNIKRKDKSMPYMVQSTMRDQHRKILSKLVDKAKLEFQPKQKWSNKNQTIYNLMIHDYRHFFGQIMRPILKDELLIKTVLTHTDRDITTRYSQYTFQMSKEVLEQYYNLLTD